MRNLTISLPTIHCESCIKLIDLTLKDVNGITAKEFNLKEKILYIRYEEDVVSSESIIGSIQNEAGYEAIITKIIF